jgi:hypothetical protein
VPVPTDEDVAVEEGLLEIGSLQVVDLRLDEGDSTSSSSRSSRSVCSSPRAFWVLFVI